MKTFWRIGYHAVSMGDLVRETGVSRGGIYSDFSGKQELFHACLDRYQDSVVTPVFAPVEAEDAGIDAIRAYFDNLLTGFESMDGVGIGCLVGNTLTQIDPTEKATRKKLEAHCMRLVTGFRKALAHENGADGPLSAADLDDLARYTMISAQGLWSYSRLTDDVAILRCYTDTLLASLKARLRGVSR
ncbi:TetR/AcrR family transcriptional regulator [Ruegeria sp. 2012CJ41-6]|uniref:TetR/AcrR family transcriptional regulator n=2 Tax=Ruegeria spongiae TaxID=2942209 RepID=A0ABT0Q567_9RHOB|nr:TetR/AcrR family transcriptional regulator [Ruegeria spongiae]